MPSSAMIIRCSVTILSFVFLPTWRSVLSERNKVLQLTLSLIRVLCGLRKGNSGTIRVNREKVEGKHFSDFELNVMFRWEGGDCWEGKIKCQSGSVEGRRQKRSFNTFYLYSLMLSQLPRRVSASVIPAKRTCVKNREKLLMAGKCFLQSWTGASGGLM